MARPGAPDCEPGPGDPECSPAESWGVLADQEEDREWMPIEDPSGSEGSNDVRCGDDIRPKLVGFWVDMRNPGKQYEMSRKTCRVWRQFQPSANLHKLWVENGIVYWGMSMNFYLEEQADGTIVWHKKDTGERAFAWRRLEDHEWPFGQAGGKGGKKSGGKQVLWYPKDNGKSKGKYSPSFEDYNWNKGMFKGKGKGKDKSKGKYSTYSSWDGKGGNYWHGGGWNWWTDDWHNGWWNDDWRWGEDGGTKGGKWRPNLLNTVMKLVKSAPDGLNIAFLSVKFAAQFDADVGYDGPEGKAREGAFKQWLAGTRRFKFLPDMVHKTLCLVTVSDHVGQGFQ